MNDTIKWLQERITDSERVISDLQSKRANPTDIGVERMRAATLQEVLNRVRADEKNQAEAHNPVD